MSLSPDERGRELDALVAEKVMGWTKSRVGHWIDPEAKMSPLAPPDYSSDIAAAWPLLDKIGGEVFLRRVEKCSGCPSRESGWECGRVEIGDLGGHNEYDVLGEGETAPLAICLAALASAGSEGE